MHSTKPTASEADYPAMAILSEEVLTLQDARSTLFEEIGRKPDKTTMYRWCLRGVGGIKLEHVRVGNMILTSKQAISRFIAARTSATQ